MLLSLGCLDKRRFLSAEYKKGITKNQNSKMLANTNISWEYATPRVWETQKITPYAIASRVIYFQNKSFAKIPCKILSKKNEIKNEIIVKSILEVSYLDKMYWNMLFHVFTKSEMFETTNP